MLRVGLTGGVGSGTAHRPLRRRREACCGWDSRAASGAAPRTDPSAQKGSMLRVGLTGGVGSGTAPRPFGAKGKHAAGRTHGRRRERHRAPTLRRKREACCGWDSRAASGAAPRTDPSAQKGSMLRVGLTGGVGSGTAHRPFGAKGKHAAGGTHGRRRERHRAPTLRRKREACCGWDSRAASAAAPRTDPSAQKGSMLRVGLTGGVGSGTAHRPFGAK